MQISSMNHKRSEQKSKKKFDCYVAENSSSKNNHRNSPPGHAEIRTGSVSGFSFVSQFGPLDCSIGSIFRDEFGKNLKMPKTNSSEDQLGRALSVLIIDDSIIQRKLTMRTLGGLIDEVMWMVEGAENGECALNLIETSPRVPDVIIVDQYMESSGGRLLGHEVAAALRRNSLFDSAVIVGCTGAAEEASPLFLEAGCDAVWSKPMPSKDEARAQIISLLQKRKNREVLPAKSVSTSRNSGSSTFTLENASGFSNGVASNSHLHTQQRLSQPLQSGAPIQQQPVFLQMRTTRVTDGQCAYFVNGGSSSGSVFQFGTPPPVEKANPSGELAHVTEAISNIDMTA